MSSHITKVDRRHRSTCLASGRGGVGDVIVPHREEAEGLRNCHSAPHGGVGKRPSGERRAVTRTMTILATLAAATLSGCGGCDGGADAPPDAAPTYDQCASAGPAFVRDATLALTGHRPSSQREVDAYVALYDQAAAALAAGTSTESPRAVVARALLAKPEVRDRWVVHFMDALRVTRVEDQTQEACWGEALRPSVVPELAAAVRDNPASGAGPGVPFTMLDLARSAVALDDLTPIYRGHLFALVSRPIAAANVPDVEAELARREDFGTVFDATYLNRDIVCLGCHNSTAAITDREDPALDRHWPLAGQVDLALFGAPTGIAPERAHAPFRFDGFVVERGGRTPWGMSPECGRFAPAAAIPDDLAMIDGHLGSLMGRRLTVFDLDAALKQGFDTLRGSGLMVAPDGTVADPDAALAAMVAASIVESVWTEIVGTPLTIANYFPRNQAARDELQRLTDGFVTNGYSLDALLVAIVSSDYFSRLPPEAGCGASPYTYPAIYDPWVIDDSDETRRGNGPGDAVAALSTRTLLSAAYAALEWPAPTGEQFPLDEEGCEELSCGDLAGACNFGACCETYAVKCQGQPATRDPAELPFQRTIGAFLKNGERGFRGLDFQARLGWEDRFGACAKPAQLTGDDFVDRALALGRQTPGATVGDVVALVKDRLVGEPIAPAPADGGPAEAAAIEALIGAPLSAPAADLDAAGLRRLCGVLLSSPQFVLSGVAGAGGPAPALTLPGDRFDDACARIRDAGLSGWTITCNPDKLTATPTAPPPAM